jgi:hypothetical protein
MTNEFAVFNLHPSARHAHQVAGQAVAVVYNDWELIDVHLGSINFSTEDESADTPGRVWHTTQYADRPFFIFSGVWAAAMWSCENEDADFYDAMLVARIDSPDGLTEYESRVDELAARFGSNPIDRAWEVEWIDKLDPMWHAVREVAAMLLDGQSVTHEDVLAAVNRCRSD